VILRLDSKGQGHAITGHECPEGKKYSSTPSLTSALEGCGWSTPRPGRCTFREKDFVPIVQEAGWAREPVLRDAENLVLTGIRSLDRPGPPYG
jgi:hypothetical protein